jgi:hypothetical protein
MMWFFLLLSSPLFIIAQAKLELYSIVPHMGPMSGNTRVTVRGKGLSENSKYANPVCRFGSK